MKKVSTRKLLFALAFSFTWFSLSAQTARIQVVHNAANAPAVDIFVGATKLFAGVPFRAASPFSNAPAGVPLQVRIKPASASNDTSNPAFFRRYTLESGKGYYLIANGNLALPGGNYAPNPDAIPTGFDITVLGDARETSQSAGNVDLRIFHGVTDAPTVDIKAQGVATLVDNAAFRVGSAYIPVPAANYTVQIAPASGSPNLLAYKAALSGLGGNTALVLASGYFNPAANTTNGVSGPAFGLWAFTPTGQAIELPKAVARAQVVHNSPNAPAVDVFVNGQKSIPGLAFRNATPFVNLDAGVPLVVALKGASASTDTSNPAFRRTYELNGDEGYYLIANGNLALAAGNYAANPDGISTAFDVTVISGAKETSAVSSNVELRIMHAVSDAPTVDIKAQGVATLVNDAPFRGFSAYIPVPAATYTIQISPASGTPNLLAYSAPITGLAGQSLLVLASGYFNPAANTTNGTPGPGFGIWAFTTSGQPIQLPTATSRVQIVHNCANAPAVDIFVNGGKAIPALDFRKATPFVNLNAGVPLTVAIKGASASSDTSNPAFKQVYELAGGESYSIVATGLLSTAGYAPNPEGRSVGFDLTILPGAKELSGLPGSSEVRVLHAATDAPKVDVRIQGGATIVDNAGFRDFTNYLPGGNQDFVLEITDSSASGVVGAFVAPLSAFADSALVVMASGFLTPSANQNGPAFGLLAVTPKGRAIMLPVFTSVQSELAARDEASVFPNPSSGSFQVKLPNNQEIISARAVSVNGKTTFLNIKSKGAYTTVEHQLPSGIYHLQLIDKQGGIVYKRFSVN